jgi:hypothetical protein
MNRWTRIAASAGLGLVLWTGTAMAQTQTPPSPPASPERVEGQVVSIDQKTGRVVLRAADGKTMEFQASPETLKDLKVGDRIEARLRK